MSNPCGEISALQYIANICNRFDCNRLGCNRVHCNRLCCNRFDRNRLDCNRWDQNDSIGTIRLQWGVCNGAAATGGDEAATGRRRGGDGRHRPEKPTVVPRWLEQVRTPSAASTVWGMREGRPQRREGAPAGGGAGGARWRGRAFSCRSFSSSSLFSRRRLSSSSFSCGPWGRGTGRRGPRPRMSGSFLADYYYYDYDCDCDYDQALS